VSTPEVRLTAKRNVAIRHEARRRFNDDDVSFDGSPPVTIVDGQGAWVQAYVWVPIEAIPTDTELLQPRTREER
jgi:hypothetical protein